MKRSEKKIVFIPVEELTRTEGHRSEYVRTLKVKQLRAILRHGDELPVLQVIPDGPLFRLVDGHHRLTAAELEGYKVVPCLLTDYLYLGDDSHKVWINEYERYEEDEFSPRIIWRKTFKPTDLSTKEKILDKIYSQYQRPRVTL
jgi:hypothetical protein